MIPYWDNLCGKKIPYVTIVIIYLNILVFAFCVISNMSEQGDIPLFLIPNHFVQTYAVNPAKVIHAFQSGDLKLMYLAAISCITYMFLHHDILHLLSNMIFLFCFGIGLESRLGRMRYVCFYLMTGVLSIVAQIVCEPWKTGIFIGASGAVSGVLGAYLMFWPTARIKALSPPVPIETSAFWFLPYWFMLEIFSLYRVEHAAISIAHFAHASGFLCGLVFAAFYKYRHPVFSVHVPVYKKSVCEHSQHLVPPAHNVIVLPVAKSINPNATVITDEVPPVPDNDKNDGDNGDNIQAA